MTTRNHPSYGRGQSPEQQDATARMARQIRLADLMRRKATLKRASPLYARDDRRQRRIAEIDRQIREIEEG